MQSISRSADQRCMRTIECWQRAQMLIIRTRMRTLQFATLTDTYVHMFTDRHVLMFMFSLSLALSAEVGVGMKNLLMKT